MTIAGNFSISIYKRKLVDFDYKRIIHLLYNIVYSVFRRFFLKIICVIPYVIIILYSCPAISEDLEIKNHRKTAAQQFSSLSRGADFLFSKLNLIRETHHSITITKHDARVIILYTYTNMRLRATTVECDLKTECATQRIIFSLADGVYIYYIILYAYDIIVLYIYIYISYIYLGPCLTVRNTRTMQCAVYILKDVYTRLATRPQ